MPDHTDCRAAHRRQNPAASPAFALLIAGTLVGCVQSRNDTLEVGGAVPPPLRPLPMELGRAGDAPSVSSLDRASWGVQTLDLSNDYVAHRPTFARRLNTYRVSARASGEFPTLAEAITLPGGPSESEQIYDAITWPIMIVPSVLAVPLGVFVERPLHDVHESPGWKYDRHAPGPGAAERRTPTGDPLTDRLGLPILTPAETDQAATPAAPRATASDPVDPTPTPGGDGR